MGVIAIIIMVLELKVPHGADFAAQLQLVPVFLSYVLSFIYADIFWNNHQQANYPSRHSLRMIYPLSKRLAW